MDYYIISRPNTNTFCFPFYFTVSLVYVTTLLTVSFCLCFYVSRYWFLLCLLYFISLVHCLISCAIWSIDDKVDWTWVELSWGYPRLGASEIVVSSPMYAECGASCGLKLFLQRGRIACNAERCDIYGNSVCPSVWPSHANTLSRRMNIGSRGLHCKVAKTF